MTISNLHSVLTGCLVILKADLTRRFILCRDNNRATWFATDPDDVDDLVEFYNTEGAVAVAHIQPDLCQQLVDSPQFEIFEINLTSQVQFHAPDPRRMDLRQYLAPDDTTPPTRQESDTNDIFPAGPVEVKSELDGDQ